MVVTHLDTILPSWNFYFKDNGGGGGGVVACVCVLWGVTDNKREQVNPYLYTWQCVLIRRFSHSK